MYLTLKTIVLLDSMIFEDLEQLPDLLFEEKNVFFKKPWKKTLNSSLDYQNMFYTWSHPP